VENLYLGSALFVGLNLTKKQMAGFVVFDRVGRLAFEIL
jgi:hypothetical protein